MSIPMTQREKYIRNLKQIEEQIKIEIRKLDGKICKRREAPLECETCNLPKEKECYIWWNIVRLDKIGNSILAKLYPEDDVKPQRPKQLSLFDD